MASHRLSLVATNLAALLLLGVVDGAAQTSEPPAVDMDDLIQECQQTVRGKNHTGMVWWVPVEFWEATDPASREHFDPLREYTTIVVAVGRVGAFGINWSSEEAIRANIVLRDADGAEYRPLPNDKVSPEVQAMPSMMKAFFAQALGQMGESMQVLFFPARTRKGGPLADARSRGTFAVVINELAGDAQQTYSWKLPLTSLSPPRHCPVGKERVKADWEYCPWHGVRLNEPEGGARPQ